MPTPNRNDDEAPHAHYATAGGAVLAMAGLAAVLGIGLTVTVGPDVGFIDGRSALILSAVMVVIGVVMRRT